MAAEERNVARD